MRRSLTFLLSLLTLLVLGGGVAWAASAGAGRPAGARASHGRGAAPTPTTLVAGAPLDGGYQLASDAAGAASVMWTQTRVVGQSVDAVIDLRQQGPRGGWGATQQIGGVLATSEAQLAVASNGAAIVTWTWVQSGRGQRTVVDAATRPSADAAWSKARQIWSSPLASGASIATAIDAAGQATVAWAGYDGAANVNPRILTAGVNAISGRVSPVSQAAGPGAGGLEPNLAVGASGAAVLSWQRQLSAVRHGATSARVAEMAAYRSPGGSWSHPAQLGDFSADSDASDGVATEVWSPSSPTSAVGAGGTAAVAWSSGGSGAGTLEVASRPASGTGWSAAHALGGGVSGFGLEPGPATGTQSSVVAVWSVGDRLLSAAATDAGAFARPGQIATIKQGTSGPELAPGPGGAVLATPVDGAGGSAVQYALRNAATGRWSGMARAGSGADGEVAAGPRGGAILVWESAGSGGNDTLYARGVR